MKTPVQGAWPESVRGSTATGEHRRPDLPSTRDSESESRWESAAVPVS
ncbi:hypothetical protein LG3211_2676 [Lysobacter gummosus]|nr:hypothetical protein LG3211_2676 [Lysobacter gummosus]